MGAAINNDLNLICTMGMQKSNPYALKDTAAGSEMTAWTSASLQPTTGYYSYDPMSAYGYGASYDLAARRKNATRESTATLKAWLNEHKKNPYPTKGEKIMLAIITKMTLTQVSTWFANARRRLKKENKMTWEPKNRTDDDDDAIVSEDEKDKDDMDSTGNKIIGAQEATLSNAQNKSVDEMSEEDRKPLVGQVQDLRSTSMGFSGAIYHGGNRHAAHSYHPYQMHAHHSHHQSLMSTGYAGNNGSGEKLENNSNNNNNNSTDSKNLLSRDCGVPVPATKPKIWSLADTVACKTPPPTVAYLGQQQQQQQQHHHLQQHQQHMDIHQQQQQQQQHQQPPIQHMMSNYGGASFTRAPITAYENFQGAPTTQQHRHTTNSIPYHNNNNNTINTNHNIINHNRNTNNNNPQYNNPNSNNISIMPITTTNPHTQQQHQQQQQQQPQQHHQLMPAHMRMGQQQQGVNQRGMGFPEAQPDTPPQTPPNMKVPGVVSATVSAVSIQAVSPTTAVNQQIYTATPLPTIATCRNNNINYTDSAASNLAINFGVRFVNDYSPRDDNSSSCSNSISGRSSANDAAESPTQSHISREATTAFKTLLKSPQHNPMGGYVSALQ